MAKSPVRLPSLSGGGKKKVVVALVLFALAWFAVKDPTSAAATVTDVVDWAGRQMGALETFANALFG